MRDSEFDTDTPLTPTTPGRFDTVVSPRWSVGVGANGGYVAGLLAKGLIEGASIDPAGAPDTGHRHLRSMTVHLLAPNTPGPAELETRILRSGRSATVIDAAIHRDGSTLAVARGVIAADREGPRWHVRPAPDFPDPDSIVGESWPDPNMIRSRYDTRYVVGGFPPPPGQETAEVSGWIRPVDHAPIGLAQLVALCDAWPPPIMMVGDPPTMARTIDITFHLFDTLVDPYDDWVAMTNRSTVSADGYVDTETEAWSTDGRLLAQARQLSATMPWVPTDMAG